MSASNAKFAPPPSNPAPNTPGAIFDARGTQAIGIVSGVLDESELARLAAEPTDLIMLYRALSEPAVLQAVAAQDPDVVDHWRWAQMRRRLLEAEGGTLGAQDFADQLDISRQSVTRRRQAGKLVALDLGRHGFRYAAWQLDDGGVVDGIPEALAAFEDIDQWMQYAWFLNANTILDDRRPLDLLRKGDTQPVIRAASRYGKHGGL